MNELIDKLIEQCTTQNFSDCTGAFETFDEEKFAELIVEECRIIIVELYHKTSLELCGPLLTADEKIVEHFYGGIEE